MKIDSFNSNVVSFFIVQTKLVMNFKASFVDFVKLGRGGRGRMMGVGAFCTSVALVVLFIYLPCGWKEGRID